MPIELPGIIRKRGSRWLNWRIWAGILGLAMAVLVAFTLNPTVPRLAIFWIFGLAFGFILQRSRFCFVTGFSNLYLFRDGRVLKGILAGLAVATVGFAFIMYSMVPDPGTGTIPVNAHASPFGWHLVLAGVLFGLGMVLAGGCIAGTLYRIGEGIVSSLIALLGILIGIGILLHNWSWWWQNYISQLPRIWLPQSLGWVGAILLTLAVLAVAYLLVHLSKPRSNVMVKPVSVTTKATGLRDKLTKGLRLVFIAAWPVALGGIILGLMNSLEYLAVDRPWGVTGEISRWSSSILNFIQLPPPEIIAVPGT